jgi:hypothetical protein
VILVEFILGLIISLVGGFAVLKFIDWLEEKR